MASDFWLIAGLGNPGPKYEGTRHNMGFMAADLLAERWSVNFSDHKGLAMLGKGVMNLSGRNVKFFLAKPLTYMNESGRSVAQIAKFFKIAPEDILIIHDDMDMPIAKIRIRAGGKSGGHNGIKSIIADLGTEKFNRLKIGIRHPQKQSVVSWVLTPFDADQQKAMDQAFATSAKIIDDFIAGKSAQYLMNKYN